MITDVVISGAGPNGLMLACELRLAGIRPVVLERLPEPSQEPKANGLLGQVVKMIDRRGLYERLSGTPGPPRPNSDYFMFAALGMDLSLLEDSPVYALPAPQPHIVQVLEERATELGAEVRRGHEVVGLSQDGGAVTVDVAGPDGTYQLHARYLVGADGGHSVTRTLAGIDFPGVTRDRTTTRSAHATVPAEWIDPATGALHVPGYGAVRPFLPHRTEHGGFSYAPFPGLPPLVTTVEWDQPEPAEPMTVEEMGASIGRVLGAEVPLEPPTGDGPHMLRRQVGGNTRVAGRFRDGRVLLIGDAAHVGTAGGSGLNLGLQDAVNLGWKLAAEIRGGAPPGLLDSYETERRPAALRMVMFGRAQAALTAPGSDVTGLRELFTELLRDRSTVQRLADLTAGTDISYDPSDGLSDDSSDDPGGADAHPLVGRFAPDMVLQTATGTVRLAELTRTARPLLLDLTEDAAAAGVLSAWQDQVDLVTARPQDPDVAAAAMLVRPDGYVAWASGSPRPESAELDALHQALRRWVAVAEPVRG